MFHKLRLKAPKLIMCSPAVSHFAIVKLTGWNRKSDRVVSAERPPLCRLLPAPSRFSITNGWPGLSDSH
jgi:hypothetical protein